MPEFKRSFEQPPAGEYTTINDITAKCRRSNCDWQATGSLNVEINTGSTDVFSAIFILCQQHHEETRTVTGILLDHNQFILFHNGNKVGFASVSSVGSTGMYNPPIKRSNLGNK